MGESWLLVRSGPPLVGAERSQNGETLVILLRMIVSVWYISEYMDYIYTSNLQCIDLYVAI